jgi:hypothetical protein
MVKLSLRPPQPILGVEIQKEAEVRLFNSDDRLLHKTLKRVQVEKNLVV